MDERRRPAPGSASAVRTPANRGIVTPSSPTDTTGTASPWKCHAQDLSDFGRNIIAVGQQLVRLTEEPRFAASYAVLFVPNSRVDSPAHMAVDALLRRAEHLAEYATRLIVLVTANAEQATMTGIRAASTPSAGDTPAPPPTPRTPLASRLNNASIWGPPGGGNHPSPLAVEPPRRVVSSPVQRFLFHIVPVCNDFRVVWARPGSGAWWPARIERERKRVGVKEAFVSAFGGFHVSWLPMETHVRSLQDVLEAGYHLENHDDPVFCQAMDEVRKFCVQRSPR